MMESGWVGCRISRTYTHTTQVLPPFAISVSDPYKPSRDKLAAEGVITYETNGQVAEVSSSGVGCELGVRRIEGLREWLGAAMHRSVQLLLLLLLRRKKAG